ncbi:GAF domain-containing protein [uncultured Deinococcus sp.]|uniref:GAF domain-containing protein n=1 Tax=uncultured Deinococcus sp. TaxID=158789 RepID=UPI0025F7E433|nr:GAF domain-containing protein [uncultured Deinococcus sp.]
MSHPAGGEDLVNRHDMLDESRAHTVVDTWRRITQALGDAVTPEAVINTVVDESVRLLGADAGSVMLVTPDGQHLEIRGTTGYDPGRVEAWRVLPLQRRTPSTEAYVTQTAILIERSAEAIQAYPALREVLAQVTGSFASLPLTVRDQTLGVLALSFYTERRFDATDRAFLSTLANVCAQSLQRSAALAEAHLLNTRLQFLAEAGAILSRSLDLTTILDSLARLTVPDIADWCVIYLPGPDGRLEPVTITHQDPQMVTLLQHYTRRYPTHASADSGVGRVYATGQPELVATITDEMYETASIPEEHRRDLRQLHLRSIITVPMLVAGRPIGVLGFGRTTAARAYTPDDLDFAQQVAARAGKAVENARLHRELQQELTARLAMQQVLDDTNAHLEDRVRERTEELQNLNDDLQAFAHSVSHDLRTPIRHITSFADLLSRHLPPGTDRAARALDQIKHGAHRLSATVDGLLVLTRSSQQPLNCTDVALDALLTDVIADLDVSAALHPVEWRIGPLPTIRGDAALLALVMQNLLHNAVKFTAHIPQPVIDVSASHREATTFITVHDNGPGFDPTYAHKLFQPFQRLHHPAEFEGTGLGLANVRRIVQRHGGHIWAASAPGQGATFTFTLPD